MVAILRSSLSKIGRLVLYVILSVALFFIGLAKGVIVGPPATVILFVGQMAVVLGLWPLHAVSTFYAVTKTKKVGLVVKMLTLLLLPIPLLLWPVLVAVTSVLVGVGYGFGTPLIATFEAVGEDREDKFLHTFVDGTLSTWKGTCTIVRDTYDLCFHSYCDYLKEFRVGEPKDGKRFDIKLRELPGSVAVGVLGLVADTPIISLVAVIKGPILLIKGWERLLQNVVGRHGPCLEAVCIPFAGLAILLWPLAVVVSVVSGILSSPFIGLFGAVVAYQECSIRCGLAYIVAAVSEFDEYTNDVLQLTEGSCFPRPKYRKQMGPRSGVVASASFDSGRATNSPVRGAVSQAGNPRLSSSRSLRQTFKEVRIVQIWDNMFKNLDNSGKALIEADVLSLADLERYMRASKISGSKVIAVGLPSYSFFHFLLRSARAGSTGLLMADGTELTMFNRPQDRLVDWFLEPLLTLKDQLRAVNLTEEEEHYLEKLLFTLGDAACMEAWDNGGIEPEDGIRKGELQALGRRLQGIATAVTRLPTHRRQYESALKSLLLFAQGRNGSASKGTPRSSTRSSTRSELSRVDTQGSSTKETPSISKDLSLDAAMGDDVV